MLLNFALQDTLHMLFAIILFPIVSVFPGYVIGWALDIFSFKHRTLLAQYVLAIALSSAVLPIILFLAFRFASIQFGVALLVGFLVSWAAIQIKLAAERRINLNIAAGYKTAFTMAGIWIVFCIVLLVDIQVGQRLYFNAAAHDFTTRTALIEAITRTGVPPINPSYYPGHFVRITELYYFWYIAASAVDTIGGKWVDARIALFAGITWSGLALLSTIATYLRVRNRQSGKRAWRESTRAAQLLAVSGLDFIPVMFFMILAKTTYGNLPFDARIEGWNPPIMSWLNALTWVPNHVTSMSACMIAMLAILSCNRAGKSRWAANVLLAGTSIGSAFGLSLWVTFTFGVFMAIWAISLAFQKSGRAILLAVLAAGLLAVVVASPFLLDLLRAGGKSGITGAFPISLYVRHFSFVRGLAPGLQEIIGALLLPLNYFLELGFFFAIAVLWIRQKRKSEDGQDNSFWTAEILLLATVTVLLSFVKSTVLALDDLGIRGWLLAQFILIVWVVDLLASSSRKESISIPSLIKSIPLSKRSNDFLMVLAAVGIMTTALEASSTRFWALLVDTGIPGVPNEISPDTNLGKRTYDARLAYEYIRDHTPSEMFIQNNPTRVLDRPSGLYGTRQMVIADRTAYGVPLEIFREMSASIGRIFLAKNVRDWVSIDKICTQYSIQAIVVNDTDPLWSSVAILGEHRTPIYINQHYAVFGCGNRK